MSLLLFSGGGRSLLNVYSHELFSTQFLETFYKLSHAVSMFHRTDNQILENNEAKDKALSHAQK